MSPKGTIETVRENIVSVKNAAIEEVKLEQTKKKLDFTGLFIDPIAQSFACDDVDGVYVTSVDVFFQAKDNNGVPVTCQLRTMQTGLPTTTVLPFSNVDKNQMRLNLVIMLQFLQDLSLILLCIWKVGLNIALYSCLTRLNIKLLFPEWVKLTLDSEMITFLRTSQS